MLLPLFSPFISDTALGQDTAILERAYREGRWRGRRSRGRRRNGSGSGIFLRPNIVASPCRPRGPFVIVGYFTESDTFVNRGTAGLETKI